MATNSVSLDAQEAKSLHAGTIQTMNDQNYQNKPLLRRVRREANGNWSATVFTADPEPSEAGRYQYKTRSQARKALLSHEIGEAGRLT